MLYLLKREKRKEDRIFPEKGRFTYGIEHTKTVSLLYYIGVMGCTFAWGEAPVFYVDEFSDLVPLDPNCSICVD